MVQVPIFIRYAQSNERLPKLTNLSLEDNLVFHDEWERSSPEGVTMRKFFLLTLMSPLSSLVHLVRSVCFLCLNEQGKAQRAFLGALCYPFVSLGCFAGSMLTYLITFVNGRESHYIRFRRAYARFEGWTNNLDLKNPHLLSYAKRINHGFWDILPTSTTNASHHNWFSATCMQPVLERGWNNEGGLQDLRRMQKLFSLVPFSAISRRGPEGEKIVIESSYNDEKEHFTNCNGCIEHQKEQCTFCCCYRCEQVYDRVFCFSFMQVKCTDIRSNSSCDLSSAGLGPISCCTCSITPDYKEDNDKQETVKLTGCFGPTGNYGCFDVRNTTTHNAQSVIDL